MTGDDDTSAYESLTTTDPTGEARWAFGTGFADPLEGVDTTVPVGVDGADLAAYCLALGDDALIASHRLTEWTTHAPELEAELALANVALDLLGQARLLLTRAGVADGSGRSEDDLAFRRTEQQMRNVRLVEAPNGDFAECLARMLVLSSWRLALFEGLTSSRDPVLAAIAAKAVKELHYHRDYAAGWVIRLGDGTGESARRMRAGLASVWPLVDELFEPHDVELRMAAAGVGVDPSTIRPEVETVLQQVLAAATLEVPDVAPMARVAGRAGRDGVHTEALGHLLAELQSVARAHPGASW